MLLKIFSAQNSGIKVMYAYVIRSSETLPVKFVLILHKLSIYF